MPLGLGSIEAIGTLQALGCSVVCAHHQFAPKSHQVTPNHKHTIPSSPSPPAALFPRTPFVLARGNDQQSFPEDAFSCPRPFAIHKPLSVLVFSTAPLVKPKYPQHRATLALHIAHAPGSHLLPLAFFSEPHLHRQSKLRLLACAFQHSPSRVPQLSLCPCSPDSPLSSAIVSCYPLRIRLGHHDCLGPALPSVSSPQAFNTISLLVVSASCFPSFCLLPSSQPMTLATKKSPTDSPVA